MPDTKKHSVGEFPWAADVRQLLDRASRGDQTSLPELRQLLDGRPEVWRALGDLARHAELSLLRLVAGGNLLAQECVQRRLQELKAELAGPEPTPLERLLVDRVGVCWLMVHGLDLELAGLDKGQAAGPLGFSVQPEPDPAAAGVVRPGDPPPSPAAARSRRGAGPGGARGTPRSTAAATAAGDSSRPPAARGPAPTWPTTTTAACLGPCGCGDGEQAPGPGVRGGVLLAPAGRAAEADTPSPSTRASCACC